MTDQPFKTTVKDFLTFWKPSLARKLTLSFTIFGLLIGYVVFIFLAVSSTNTFIKVTSESVGQYLASISRDDITDKEGELFKIIDQRMMNIEKTAEVLQGIFPSLKYDLYFQKNGIWQHTYKDAQGIVQSKTIADPVFSQSLDKAKTKRIQTSSLFFYGAEDTVNIKINISPMHGGYTQIISFDIHRMGFLKMLQRNISKAVLFFVLLLVISHSLGHLFSIRLARPIIKLSREAETIASGQYKRRFTTDQKDEIGMLANSLNTMASRIIDGTRERENLLLGILIALTRAIDAKSPWTAGHSERVTKFAEAIGCNLHLNDDEMRILSISAILHDIGKIAVPEQILDKPGKLSDEEFAIVKKHPQAGADIISSIPSYETILPGILYHHERWDGQGYPTGVSGKDIPLFARIICIADVYDALTEDRPYRKAWESEQVLQFFEDQKGKMFDPEFVDIFISVLQTQKNN